MNLLIVGRGPTTNDVKGAHIAGAIGLGASIDWLTGLGWDAVAAHERDVLDYAIAALDTVPDLRRVGTAEPRVPLLGFVLEGVHPHDVVAILSNGGFDGLHQRLLVLLRERFGDERTG